MAVRYLQDWKACSPILVTLAGIVISDKPEHPKKAELPMLVTSSGIIVAEHPKSKALVLVSIIALQPPRESYIVFPSATMIEERLMQFSKAASPILATLAGMVIEERLPCS